MEENKDFEEMRERHEREKISYADKGRFFKLRNILNIIFMLLAIIGMVLYFYKSQEVGGVILVAAVFVKLTECVLRIMH